jgi:glutamate dehydrogenase (NAD(P)+)
MELTIQDEGPQLVCTVGRGTEPLGFVVIDSTVAGRSCGGLRMLPDVDEAELRLLARDMTFKYGFLGLPQGGAKAGVRGDPEAPPAERWERLARFGEAIAPLLHSHAYVPGTDMGTNLADIRHMLNTVGVPLQKRELRVTRSGYYTALTVFAGAKQAAQQVGLDLSACRVAIEGFGHVGGSLAGLMAGAQARVVAISTSQGALYNERGLDVPRLQQMAAERGSRMVEAYAEAERLDRAGLLELPVDVLCPCARHNSVNSENVTRVNTRILCPGANSPVTPEAERLLFERGVVCLPDFVTNSGGVLGGTMEFASLSEAQIAAFIEQHVGPRIRRLLEEAARQGVLVREVAEPLALRRLAEVQRRAARVTLRGRVFGFGLGLYRRGWLPGAPLAPLARRYFEKTLG